MSIESSATDASEGKSPGPFSHGPGAPARADGSADIFRILSDTLRGRYCLTLALCLLVGGIGAAAGWFWTGPLYHCEGMVRIASTLPPVLENSDQNQTVPMFDSFMQAQQELLTSRSLLEAALRDPMWDAKGIASKRPTVDAMAINLKIDVRPRSENLRLSYEDRNPAVASAAVQTIIAAYQNLFEKNNQKLNQQRMQMLLDYRTTLTNQLKALTQQVVLVKPSAASAPASEIPAPSQFEIPSALKVAMIDQEMDRLLTHQNDTRDQLDQASMEFGPEHPYVIRLAHTYEIASDRVNQYLADFIAEHPYTDGKTANSSTFSAAANSFAPSPDPAVQQTTQELDRIKHRVELLKAESAMPKRFEIVDAGDLPIHQPNRQIKWTIAGAGAGSGMVIAIMVMVGMNRKRYRMCADVMETIGQTARFVTAVPNLSATGKSRQALDAAQSMHFFRHKLQQKGAAYMVTSADSGEGRTSLVMSLAVSLCGSGVRTLVIDADLATRGLTRALKMDNLPGFVEMIRNNESPAPLEMPGNSIAILPAGDATEADGLSISQPAFARLLGDLKKEFDVILIDTGPALGRIEACVMARQVDGVLLAIRRGQKRSLWDETLQELESVAQIYGAVFNRADPKDFERSIRRRGAANTSQRSRPISGPLANLGPLVRSVASSLTQDIQFFPITSAVANTDIRKVA